MADTTSQGEPEDVRPEGEGYSQPMATPLDRFVIKSGALQGRILFGDDFPMALPWAGSELPGASDSAEVLTGFLKNAE